jgi:succinate dehydrogenase / fumarate reductase membrane anchor subunit
MTMETPLHKVQGLGSSHSGVKHFWRQRMTAAAMVPLAIWFAWSVVGLAGARESDALFYLTRSAFGLPLNAILMGAFIVIALYHMVLGIQVVIDDYVHSSGGKIAWMLFTRAAALAVAAVSLFALFRIAGPV